MSVGNIVNLLWRHPLNQRSGRLAAIGRFARWQFAQRLMPTTMAVPFVNGSHLLMRRGMTGATGNWYCGLLEANEMGFALHLLRPGDLFVDIGANVGSYTVLAAAGTGADVICAEPIPQTFAQLRQNILFNSLDERVQAHCVGLADKPGSITFTADRDTMNRVALPGESGKMTEVPLTTLDLLCAETKPVLMKIDVEGYERQILAGGARTLANSSLLAVIMETNEAGAKFGSGNASLTQIMADHGFTACNYDALAKQLGPPVDPRNTIFIRDRVEVERRCAEAPLRPLSNGAI